MAEFYAYTATREELEAEARRSISRGDYALDEARYGSISEKSSAARAQYARASTLLQLAGYLGMTEEQEQRRLVAEAMIAESEAQRERLERNLTPDVERELQDAYLAGRDLEAKTNREDGFARDTGGTSQRRGVHGDPWRSR